MLDDSDHEVVNNVGRNAAVVVTNPMASRSQHSREGDTYVLPIVASQPISD